MHRFIRNSFIFINQRPGICIIDIQGTFVLALSLLVIRCDIYFCLFRIRFPVCWIAPMLLIVTQTTNDFSLGQFNKRGRI